MANGKLCKIKSCQQTAIIQEYCRLHYLKKWKRIKAKQKKSDEQSDRLKQEHVYYDIMEDVSADDYQRKLFFKIR